MKKFSFLIIVFLFGIFGFAQNYKYALLTDIHIGAPGADNDLRLVVSDINKREGLKFVIITGDVTEKGRASELVQAKEILDELKLNYFIIPGNHDTKWSDNGCTKFLELWGDDKFIFDFQNIKHVGVNSGIPWRGGGGHVSVEQLNWLKNILKSSDKNQEIIFYIHHPLDGDVDNWFEVTNLLSEHNVKVVFYGHGHANQITNFAGIPAAMCRSTLSEKKSPGYTQIELSPDSIKLFEVKIESDNNPRFWGGFQRSIKNIITKIDSAQFISYSNKVQIVYQKDLKKSISTSLLYDNNKIFSTSISGDVNCYDLKGNLIWHIDLGKTIFSRAAIADNILTTATIEGDLITIDAQSGEIIQTLGIGEPLTSQLVIANVDYNNEKLKGIIVGTSSGKIYCYELKNLELIWENNSASLMIETQPLVIQDKVIFGSWDNYLYCLSLSTGSLIWKWTENKNFYYSPAACIPVSDGKNVFISTPDKNVSAVDLLLGTTAWRKKDYNGWESIGLSRDKKRIFIKSISDKFYFVSPADGKLIKEVSVGFSLDTMPIEISDWNQNVIFGCKNGMVYLIDSKYNVYKLFFMGTSRVHSILHLKENLFAASNMDGKIIVFKINPNDK